MAVKFSQFTTGSSLADIDYFVGYKGTDNIQVAKSLLSGTTYTIDVPAATTNINLAGSDSTNDAIILTGGQNITLSRTSANEINIATTTLGDTYTINAGAKVGSSVPLQLDAAAGTDSAVSLTEGAGITLTQTSATEITVAATATGTSVVKDQFTGNNSTTAFTLSVTPTAAANLNIFISGVYQNSKDSGGTANYTVAGTTLTFATAPPTTAANGIEVVITQ
ncbi:MAG: hypothetical protein GY787_05420 [Alteromonadales bacterium]|nr:hypothetical protein [Alteromonadales bacterium]